MDDLLKAIYVAYMPPNYYPVTPAVREQAIAHCEAFKASPTGWKTALELFVKEPPPYVLQHRVDFCPPLVVGRCWKAGLDLLECLVG
jgi:hypothetical protein